MDKEFYTQFQDANVSALLSFIAEGLVVFDLQGRITTINPHASLLLDYTVNELIGKKLDEIISIYLDESLIPKNIGIATSVAKGKVFTVPSGKTLYFQTRGGSKFPVFASAKPIRFSKEGEGTNGGVLVFRDITTEKELERYKESTARTLSQLTPILQKASTGDFTHYPELPKQEDEFTELLVGLRLMLDDLRELDRAREKNEKEKIHALEEKRILTEKYSKELELEVDRKTNELSRAKKHIETIIESLTNGLIEYDVDGRIIRLNKAAEDILGVNKESLIGKHVYKDDKKLIALGSIAAVTYPELSEGVKSVSREVSGLDVDVFELTITYPIERDLQVAIVPVSDGEGGSTATLRVVRDVTREKLISRSKSEFISIAAHQLRTPLSAIKWALNFLRGEDIGKLNKEQVKIVSQAFDTNDKMISLVNDLLNVARIEDGRFGYEFRKAHFRVLVQELTKISEINAKVKNITLTYSDDAGSLESFVFDSSKVAVAIQNLLDNAIKYTPEGGKIDVSLTCDGTYAHLKVKDSGVGVPKHQVSRLFTKFFRAENVTKLPVSGSGLGLFITRNIVVRHGGDIQVQSIEGKGTTFTLSLPIEESLIPTKDVVAASLYV